MVHARDGGVNTDLWCRSGATAFRRPNVDGLAGELALASRSSSDDEIVLVAELDDIVCAASAALVSSPADAERQIARTRALSRPHRLSDHEHGAQTSRRRHPTRAPDGLRGALRRPPEAPLSIPGTASAAASMQSSAPRSARLSLRTTGERTERQRREARLRPGNA